jgi:hypothetical protein
MLVIPANAGIQRLWFGLQALDPGFRRDDGDESLDVTRDIANP